MSHPDNLSHDYPVQGDTWYAGNKSPILTVTLVTPHGIIHYIDKLNTINPVKVEADLDSFKAKLKELGLGIPDTCTREYCTI